MSTVLLVGAGGREHAILWKLLQSRLCQEVVLAPGSDAMELGIPTGKQARRIDFPSSRSEFSNWAKALKPLGIDFAVIGPDNPLADGIVDALIAEGIETFGPTGAAARIEASKSFAKDVMKAANVPTARFEVFGSLEPALSFLNRVDWAPKALGWVVKADGLALGKGVVVCESKEQAESAVRLLLPLSGSLLIEEKLEGREVSWMAFCDGETCSLLEPARDFKRVGNGDVGSNTGGMGAFSPVPEAQSDYWYERVRLEVFLPTLREMKRRGCPFRGILYAGLMIDFESKSLWVLEFNARFGDPETQVLLSRMEGDLLSWCQSSARGQLGREPQRVPFKREAAVVVVEAAPGYPEKPEKGAQIDGLEEWLVAAPRGDQRVFVAGARRGAERTWEVSGGRVLGLVGEGATLAEARERAFQISKQVKFPRMLIRTDIALHAAQEEKVEEKAEVKTAGVKR